MVLVSTSVPAMNATPRVTARAVAKRRNLRASSPWKMTLNMAAHSPNRFIRSSTRSPVGWCISSTIRPSARKTIRSA